MSNASLRKAAGLSEVVPFLKLDVLRVQVDFLAGIKFPGVRREMIGSFSVCE